MALVAYYPLNGDVNDYSGNENHATNVGGVVNSNGKINSCYYLAGTGVSQSGNWTPGEYIELPNTTIADTSQYPNGTTFSFWINIDTDAADRISLLFGSGTISHIEIYSSSKYFRTEVRLDNGYSFGTSNFPDDVKGVWSHFTIVFDTNNTNRPVRWYQNGKLFHTHTSLNTGDYGSDEYFMFYKIGQSTGSSTHPYAPSFKGKIDEVRIYDHALSEFEIRELALFHPSANLVAHYPLDGDVIDYSGNMLHGIPTNVTFGDGKIKEAGVFNGTSKIITSLSMQSSDFNKNFTATAWIKRYSSVNLYNMFMGQTLLYMSFRDNNKILISPSINGTQRIIETTNTYLNNVWYFVSFTYDGEKVKIFIDGVLETERSYIGELTISGGDFSIGDGSASTWYPFNGEIDDVRIYNKALSESEIKSLAQAKIAHYKLSDKAEVATENLFNDPSFTDPTNWSATNFYEKGGADGGSYCGNTTTWSFYQDVDLTAGVTYTISGYVRMPSNNADTRVSIKNGTLYNTYIDTSGEWTYFEMTGVPDTTKTNRIYILDASKSGNEVQADKFHLEAKEYSTPFTTNKREGAIVKDSTRNHNNGSVDLTTTPTWSSDTAVGLGSMEFDGVDDIISIPEIQFNNSDSWTASLWFKQFSSQQYNFIFGNIDSYIQSIVFNSDQNFGVKISGGTYLYNDYSLELNTWHHISISYNNGNFKFYHNGKKVKEYNNELTDFYFNSIGNAYTNTSYLHNGNIADIQLFAKQLSDQEIYNLYTQKSNSIIPSSNATSKITTSHNNKTIESFITVGTSTWTCPSDITRVDALIVAGGGGGGSCLTASTSIHSGAGGAGGLLFKKGIPVTPGQTYPIIVGDGGSYDDGNYVSGSASGESGDDSSAFGFTAIGGGGGAGRNTPAKSGGSGGGGAYTYPEGASGTPRQGYDGGDANKSSAFPSGAGGGAGGPGLPYDSLSDAGDGGPGKKFDISFGALVGENGWFAGGGGGATTTPGLGGEGGGGDGSNTNGLDALPNTGGGGGGGGNTNYHGGNGGSGIVLIKYSTSNMNSKITK